MKQKIKKQDELIQIVFELKQQGRRIVVFNGSFDIFHAGHAEVLQKAKKFGDVLVVLVNSDESVKKYKGPSRPIVSEQDRAELVAALGCVDFVTLFDEITPKRLLGEMKPDIYCSGPAWGKDCIEQEIVEAHGGEVMQLEFRPGMSTSSIVEKIKETHAQLAPRAIFLDRDGVINVDHGYVHKIEDFEFIPRTVEALKRLAQEDYKLIITTNQSGIAREYYTEEQMHEVHEWMCKRLAEEGVIIDQIYYCKHHPKITGECECRKPKPGMLLRAAEDFGLSLSESWMIGDKDKDVFAGREANTKTIKLGGPMLADAKVAAHHEVADLREAVHVILNESG